MHKLSKWWDQQIAKIDIEKYIEWRALLIFDSVVGLDITYEEAKKKLEQKLQKEFPFLKET